MKNKSDNKLRASWELGEHWQTAQRPSCWSEKAVRAGVDTEHFFNMNTAAVTAAAATGSRAAAHRRATPSLAWLPGGLPGAPVQSHPGPPGDSESQRMDSGRGTRRAMSRMLLTMRSSSTPPPATCGAQCTTVSLQPPSLPSMRARIWLRGKETPHSPAPPAKLRSSPPCTPPARA